MKELVAYLAKVLVDDPAAVTVEVAREGDAVRYALTVAPGDIGKVIGREGRTVKALRTLLAAAASRTGERAELDVVDGDDRAGRRGGRLQRT